ncbi:scramblase (macronuclear) [Tetrahymena thermophila SB210]|uniref:Phospholipid scramblase n=1 Tax=Tetrahymena thermophila (strain SB210) TaxID=312017 RepID=Q22U02_TETTS|nr:scramblase [Tetrahymena thermophila SB210]EAR88885.2 scramblase [Tetrahymena thermophila SB210]|eukprot:XP_001009130.2 scramblase [Tetrahymena thermophila SB210]
MSFQYQQFGGEQNSFNDQVYQQQQGQVSVQMQQFGNNPQNGYQQIINENPVQGLPITNFPIHGQQQVINYPNNNMQIPQNMIMVPILDPLKKLADCQGIFIKQKLELLQALIGWQHENVYKVFQADVNGIQVGNNPIFLCKEKSECMQRMMLKGDMRAFNMNITNETSSALSGQSVSTPFLALERPFKCTFFAYNRPVLKVYYVENGSKVLYGLIKNPFQCCELGCEVYDANEQLKFLIKGKCCQLGLICRGLPCDSCQQYEFTVQNTTGQIVTRLLKKSSGFIKSYLSNCDDFSLGFPINSTAQEKALLMSATIFLDYMYFENKQTNNQK